jgi:hypothetical protein
MLENKVITLRNVYGKIKEVHLQPGRQKNGARFPWVKPVRYDSMGNAEMILSQDEMNSPERDYFIAEDADIVITDGTQFDLSDPYQRNLWRCIENSDQIAPTRDARDRNGNLFIDGNKTRYGMAEFYVDIPGEESERSVSKKQKITKAWTYIGADSKNGRLTKCKILGKHMNNAPDSDVEDYLYQRAEKNPDEIIELYTSGDMSLKLLLIDAKERGVIIKKDGMFVYADTLLGATDDAVIIFFKTPANKRVLDQIKFEVYPEYAPVSKIEETLGAGEPGEPAEPVETKPAPKRTPAKKN